MAFDAFCYCLVKGQKTTKDEKKTFWGETQDEDMKAYGAFEIVSFELGAENTINIGSVSSGGGAGKATFKEFTVTKKTDTASHSLFRTLVNGNHYDEVVVELRRSGGDVAKRSDLTFMKFSMKLVMVQDISWSGSDGDDVCEETVIFQYGSIKVEYWPQNPDGTRAQKPTETIWNRVRNLAVYDMA